MDETEECQVSGQEISWYYEDFEPDEWIWNVRFSIIRPSIWQRILTETEKIEKNPSDGEAWGRLGKAYKESIVNVIGHSRGYLTEFPGTELYSLSEQAYQRTLELLPNDADWHYGYAELLCTNAQWGARTEDDDPMVSWVACAKELKQALDINPKHERVNNLIDYLIEDGFDEFFDLSSLEPDFLILTPQPSATATEIPLTATMDYFSEFAIVDEVKETRAPRITITSKATSTTTQTPEPETTQVVDITDTPIVVTEVVEVSSTSSENTGSNWPIYVGSVLVLFIIGAIVIVWRRK